MDVYVVIDRGVCVGVSARLQGAELIKANHLLMLSRTGLQTDPERVTITNHDLQDER